MSYKIKPSKTELTYFIYSKTANSLGAVLTGWILLLFGTWLIFGHLCGTPNHSRRSSAWNPNQQGPVSFNHGPAKPMLWWIAALDLLFTHFILKILWNLSMIRFKTGSISLCSAGPPGALLLAGAPRSAPTSNPFLGAGDTAQKGLIKASSAEQEET